MFLISTKIRIHKTIRKNRELFLCQTTIGAIGEKETSALLAFRFC